MSDFLNISASINQQELKNISRMLNMLGDQAPRKLQSATRIAATYICDSCRARTKKADEFPKKTEYEIVPSPHPPRYITYSKGQRLPVPLHRWQLTRKKGTPDQVTRDYFTYCHTKTNKRGKVIADARAEKTELKNYRLRLVHKGLAKASWNWAKNEVKKGFVDVAWLRRKYDKRNPKNDVKGSFYETKNAQTVGATAEIHNRLDYINAACPPSAVREAIAAAGAKLKHRIMEMISDVLNRGKRG